MQTRGAARRAAAAAAAAATNTTHESAIQTDNPQDNATHDSNHVSQSTHDRVADAATVGDTGLVTPPSSKQENSRKLSGLGSMQFKSRQLTAGVPEQLQWLLTPPKEIGGIPKPNSSTSGFVDDKSDVIGESTTNTPKSTTAKRKRGSQKTSKEPVRGGWDVLPHNLGKLWTPNIASVQTSSIETGTAQGVADDPIVDNQTGMDVDPYAYPSNDTDAYMVSPVTEARYGLRTRKVVNYTIAPVEKLPRVATPLATDNVVTNTKVVDTHDQDNDSPPTKRQRRSKKDISGIGNEGGQEDADHLEQTEKVRRKARKTKDNPYGLTPGETPHPGWNAPTSQQCQEVYDILAMMHDDVQPLPPDKIPAPSLDVAGCGEVPSILDGLIRTVLSGSTTFDSADRMLQALVKRFGVLESGIGKGSVNWNNVRIAEHDDVYKQLKNGGLGKLKATNIQAILNMVYDENMERRAAYIREQRTGAQADVAGTSDKTEGQKKLEILKADEEVLSLDHMHSMDTHEAMQHFVRYPGVGVKTAACVTLFSLQRPCFAVDTHVFRMSKWLGWVPQKTNEDNTFGHLEVRCPDKLKYGLHQLFIRHGKTCHRCNDKSFMGTEVWDQTECPLEHLIDRFTKRVAKPKKLQGDGEKMGKVTAREGDMKPKEDAAENENGEEDEDEGVVSDVSELDEAGVNVESFEGSD
ncbi:hypothetical protein SCAR479_06900 [Seiridium cardinale]|uniref:HhH-GPD domain-containing protein n=1 Tax=Seiridium cardinale TaxID=138064 RepID=A0ABR2XR74_9PEZI